MYNEQIKQEFINYQVSLNDKKHVVQRYNSLFNEVGSFESAFNKDIAEMDYVEIQYVFSNVNIRGASSHARANLTFIKKYFKWCQDNNKFDTKINIDNINLKMFLSLSVSFKRHMIASPTDLINKCDMIFPDINALKFENFIRAFLYLTFCGFDSHSIFTIESNQLKKLFEENKIYPEFQEHLRKINDMTIYYRGERGYKVSNLDLLIKNFTTEEKTLSHFKIRMSTAVKAYNDDNVQNISLRFNDVWKSGIYYRTYLQEQNNSPLIKVDTRKQLKISDKDFTREYNMYKKAFEY